MPLEIERKYLDVAFDHLRERLGQVRAQGGDAHFESNLVWDSAESTLHRQGKLLRLRTREWENRVDHILTLKLPATCDGSFKVREEREVTLADNRPIQAILQGLGFTVKARYEKVREVWCYHNVEIVLDTLPFIRVVELEGAVDDICIVERDLHLDIANKSTDSYHSLHQAWLEANNMPKEPSFVFADNERATWRKQLGLN